MARPDLLDRRPGWAGGKINATNVLLEPLGSDETDRLIESLAQLDDGLRERIREAAEGNPLFVEEMVAMVRESPEGEVVVPPTIQALLAARLDQLDVPERSVLERGAVEGRTFHLGAVQALAPDETQVTARLTSLVRKELVRPDKAQLPGEDAFRFRHLLIRDAAYDALPKATRSELHERFADWLEAHGVDLVELDEILGYHLEQAARYREELGTADSTLEERAGVRLLAAGRRAHLRGDDDGTVNLLERALAVLPERMRDIRIEIEFSQALFQAGRPSEAESVLQVAEERAAAEAHRPAELLAQLARVGVSYYMDPEGRANELMTLAREAIPVFKERGDEFGLMHAWASIGLAEHMHQRFEVRNHAFEEAERHAVHVGDERMARNMTLNQGPGFLFGPTPPEESLRWFKARWDLASTTAAWTAYRSVLVAYQGRLDEARELLREAEVRARELGQALFNVHLGEWQWYVERRGGDIAVAEQALRVSCGLLEQMGEKGWLSTQAGELAYALCELDRHDEAEEWAERSRELAASDDVMSQMLWRQSLARIVARRGSFDDAEQLAREAVALGEDTDALSTRGDAHLDLAEVLELSGRYEEVGAQIETACALFEQKRDVPRAAEARARLERLL
jgi:tetratricopeptide (TPR) repeat protein